MFYRRSLREAVTLMIFGYHYRKVLGKRLKWPERDYQMVMEVHRRFPVGAELQAQGEPTCVYGLRFVKMCRL